MCNEAENQQAQLYDDPYDDFSAYLIAKYGGPGKAPTIRTVYRVFIADMGHYKEPDKYEFIADFATDKMANNYMKYMRGKQRYREKDIILKSVDMPVVNPKDGISEVAVSVLGECFYPDEYDF